MMPSFSLGGGSQWLMTLMRRRPRSSLFPIECRCSNMTMMTTTTTAINDWDHHPLVAVTSANMKEMIPTASQLFQAFDKEKTTTTASPNTRDKNNNNNNMKMAQPMPNTTSKSKKLKEMESPLQSHWSRPDV